jgi:hypothetical protein
MKSPNDLKPYTEFQKNGRLAKKVWNSIGNMELRHFRIKHF